MLRLPKMTRTRRKIKTMRRTKKKKRRKREKNKMRLNPKLERRWAGEGIHSKTVRLKRAQWPAC